MDFIDLARHFILLWQYIMRCAPFLVAVVCAARCDGSRCSCSAATTCSKDTDQKSMRRDTSFLRSAAAGGVAAATATVAFHPVDTVKTTLQSGRGGGGSLVAVRALGPRGLYRGVLPAAMSMMPACAVRMGAYEAFKSALLLRGPAAVPASALVFCASAMSVVISSTVRAPLDMIKTRVQADASTNAVGALRSAWGKGGLSGASNLYRGAGLSLVRDVPFFGFNLLIYEQLRAAATSRARTRAIARGDSPDGAQPTPLELILIGFASQGIAGFLTNPADVLKTRVQAGAAAGMGAALALGGPASLMRGAGWRVVWIAPQGCVYYPAYEAVQRMLSPS